LAKKSLIFRLELSIGMQMVTAGKTAKLDKFFERFRFGILLVFLESIVAHLSELNKIFDIRYKILFHSKN